ncbi:efflux RND transporter permease subunit [Aliidiomarina soli]|uniref:Acriflavin resistance protein n=1 Tax=Aliidiomarina soli TaxID=1928574 RepID=A0A432WJC4_9GAMM|nr:efflux RND transporter permease subunit [Aliidiomarina soli]RUO33779.1 acriflavin resistance protein [Aliidiomarina soli]
MTQNHVTQDQPRPTGIIAWFANNPVAANLLMVFIIVLGLIGYATAQRQMFPQMEVNYIHVNSVFRGAAPQEIEEGILIKVEEALQDVEGIKRVRSVAWRGGGQVSIELDEGEDISQRLDQVKLNIDSIATFPAGMEPLTIYQVEFRQQAVELVLTGSDNPIELKEMGRDIERELLQLNNVSFVDFNSMPAWEIGVEVAPETLRRYAITLQDVATAIRQYSDNLSAGNIRTESGMIAIRSEQRAYRGDDFAQIPVIVGNQGEIVYLGDIATIHDGFEERINYMRYNGQPSAFMAVNASSSQSLPDVAGAVNDYVEWKNTDLPPGFELNVLVDMTYYLNGRLTMMLTNMLQGGVLVFLMLMLFLRMRVAFWVMLGLPVAFLGAFWLMPFFSISINIISLFAFIMVLGIVVDDAIVTGESAYAETEANGHSIDNVVRGAQHVAVPATFGVLTTIAVFAPFLMTQGMDAAFFKPLAGVVILCLIFSLIESKLILPAHLAHTKLKPLKENDIRARFNRRFQAFINNVYQPLLHRCISHRYMTFAVFVALFIISMSLITSGHVRNVGQPKVSHDYPSINFEMNQSASEQQTLAALQSLEQMFHQVEAESQEEFGQPMMVNILAFLNGQTQGRILMTLVAEDDRPYNSFELSRRWREAMPEIAGLRELTIYDSVMSGGGDGDLGYRLFARDLNQLNDAGNWLAAELRRIPGFIDISSTIDSSAREFNIALKPRAHQLGLTPATIVAQVGHGFYGAEAQRMIRDGDEVRVMVRYPRDTREQISELEYTRIRLANGDFVMLGDVAQLEEVPGVARVNRESGFRTVRVFGSVDQAVTTSGEVATAVSENIMPELLERFPGVRTELGGDFAEQQQQAAEMVMFFVAGLLAVFILLAIPLKSYSQPLIVMSVIPFGMIGAVWGHFILGYDLSMMSFFGIIAAAGVVINDSLVLTSYVNYARSQGLSMYESVMGAGRKRFRAIILTSLTTFFGLLPIMFEKSLQAQFVIPMAISLAFAVLFATMITLLLVPCLYLILDDFKGLLVRLFGRILRRRERLEESSTTS